MRGARHRLRALESAWAGVSDGEGRCHYDFRTYGRTVSVPTLYPRSPQSKSGLGRFLTQIAARKKTTPAQIALAWLLAQKPWIVPIPGTRKLERLDEKLGAAAITLTADDLREIETAAANITVQGPRGTGKEQYI